MRTHHHGALPRRRLVAVTLGATAAIAMLAAGPVATVDAAPLRPAAVAGNRQSPAVATVATSALGARDVYAYTQDAGALEAYRGQLLATADAVAAEFAADPLVVRAAFERADFAHQTAALAALSQLGVNYRHASSQPGVAFDCSGLTAFAWRRAGVAIPHQSSSQMHAASAVDPSTALVGDLVQYPGHVMLYLGFGDAIVHAANSASDVELSHAASRSLRWANPIGG